MCFVEHDNFGIGVQRPNINSGSTKKPLLVTVLWRTADA